ncbi:MAG: guanylate kinase [Chloroflexi bacterium]|nr:guanylate kinase [Chloroflexota bacterium]
MGQGHHPPPLLVVISGPSGVGKDSVLALMRRRDRPWHFVVTATTRPRRAQEQEGMDYLFLAPSQFEELLAQDGLLEHAEVYGYRYGVPRSQVEVALRAGQDVIVKTDVQGARTLRARVPGALLIFLAPPSLQELERRLRERKTESAEALRRRIATARQELACQSAFDHVVVNHNGRLKETVASIERIIGEEKARRARGDSHGERDFAL